jgi:putative DNA primase/helicase
MIPSCTNVDAFEPNAYEKPPYLRPIPENIPSELKAHPQWVLWKAILRDERWTKVPYQVNGMTASPTNPATWNRFQVVLERFEAGGYDGIGIVLTRNLGLVGIDMDKYVTDGIIDSWAQSIIDRIESYTELSPSSTGIRIFCKGSLPVNGKRKGNIEFYKSGRYLTVTGHTL